MIKTANDTLLSLAGKLDDGRSTPAIDTSEPTGDDAWFDVSHPRVSRHSKVPLAVFSDD